MKNINELVTPEKLVEQMRADAIKIREVAELVSLNREAFAVHAQRIAKLPLSEQAAMGLVKIIFDVLSEFAEDMDEAVEATDRGDMQARVVDFGIVGDDKAKH